MPDLKTLHLRLPASTADLRGLEIGSVAYLNGRLFTAREGLYNRAIGDGFGMPAVKDALGITNFHCSPAASINPDGSYTVGAVTATASFRFAQWLDGWFKLSGCNIIIGKGGMTSEVYREFFVPNNAIYLTTVGYGTGALLGRGIRRVAGVYWLEELGLAQAVWVLEVKISVRFWSRATSPATACSSARTPRSHPASNSIMPAPDQRRCAAMAKPTTRPRKSFESPQQRDRGP